VAAEARRRAADGIISNKALDPWPPRVSYVGNRGVCGHFHHASDRTFEGVHYLNCGDWVESCTAVVESHSGEMQVVHWADCQVRSGEPGSGFPATLHAAQPSASSSEDADGRGRALRA
jgi:hypothetical protein